MAYSVLVQVQWAQSMGMATMAMDSDERFKTHQANFSLIATDWIRLQVAQIPTTDLKIW